LVEALVSVVMPGEVAAGDRELRGTVVGERPVAGERSREVPALSGCFQSADATRKSPADFRLDLIVAYDALARPHRFVTS
jgi:hypothetical protein